MNYGHSLHSCDDDRWHGCSLSRLRRCASGRERSRLRPRPRPSTACASRLESPTVDNSYERRQSTFTQSHFDLDRPTDGRTDDHDLAVWGTVALLAQKTNALIYITASQNSGTRAARSRFERKRSPPLRRIWIRSPNSVFCRCFQHSSNASIRNPRLSRPIGRGRRRR